MKNHFLASLVFACAAGSILRSDEATPYVPQSIASKHPNRIYFGPEFLWLNLNTEVHGAKIKGTDFLWGIPIGYEYLKPHAFYAGVDLMSVTGSNKLHAHRKGRHFSDDRHRFGFSNLDTRFGYTFAGEGWRASPFLGAGIFSLGPRHHGSGFKEGLIYLSGGVRFMTEVSRLFDYGLNLKIFIATGEERYRHGGTTWKRDQNACGGEVGVPLVWRLGSRKRWDAQLEPYFLKLAFAETQNIFGTRILFGYRF